MDSAFLPESVAIVGPAKMQIDEDVEDLGYDDSTVSLSSKPEENSNPADQSENFQDLLTRLGMTQKAPEEIVVSARECLDSSLDSGIASSRESSFRNVSVNEESLDDCRESSPGSFTQESLSPVPSFGSEPQTTVSPPTRPEPMAPHLFAVHLTATLGVENALRFAMSSTAENFMAEAQKQTTAMMPKKRARTERKPRENYSKAEQAALEEFYEKTKHPQFEEKKELAAKIGLSYQRVQKWFENRRQRDKTIQKARAMVVEV